MRKSTRDFIKIHRGEEFTKKTGTLIFISKESGETIPSDVAEELDRLGRIPCHFDGYKFTFKII